MSLWAWRCCEKSPGGKMWKQLLHKLSRKSSASGKGDHAAVSSPGRNAAGNGSGIQRTSSCPSAGPARPAPGVKRMSSAVFPSSVVAGIEPLVPFKDVPNGEKLNLFVSKVSLCSPPRGSSGSRWCSSGPCRGLSCRRAPRRGCAPRPTTSQTSAASRQLGCGSARAAVLGGGRSRTGSPRGCTGAPCEATGSGEERDGRSSATRLVLEVEDESDIVGST